MKKLLLGSLLSIVLPAFAVAMGVGGSQAEAFSGFGAGTGSNPYIITTCEELQEMSDDVDADYVLANDIDCSDTTTWNSGSGFLPVGDPFVEGGFSGQFDGNGFVISNLFINRGASNNIGLFALINSGGVEDLGLVNPDITGNISVGGIAGNVSGSSDIRWVYVRGGSVHANFTQAGGIVGRLSASTITSAYSTAAVTSSGDDTGGITSLVEEGATVVDSFWDTETSGQATSAGGGTGRTTVQMKTVSTYTDGGWDFDSSWDIDEAINDGYPFLRSFMSDDDYNGDDLPDELQGGISSYINPITGKRIVIDVGEACEITTDDYVEESDLDAQDAAWEYANGLFDFEGDCGTPGFTTTITLMYYDVELEDATLRKYNENTGEYSEITTADIEVRTINGSTVTVASYNLTDGGELDMDGVADGVFTDPAGLATSVALADTGEDSQADSEALAATGSNQQLAALIAALTTLTGALTLRRLTHKLYE